MTQRLMQRLMQRQRVIPLLFLSGIALIVSACTDNNVASNVANNITKNTSNDKSSGVVPKIKLQRIFANVPMDNVVLMLQAPGDDAYWYIVEKAGRVLRIENKPDAATASVFLDISDRVEASPNEAGLLGMTFHPQYAQNGYVYLSYTASNGGLVSHISRFENRGNTDNLSPDSETVVLTLGQPYSNHNGGNIQFGPDGYLYIGFGDGGSGGDPQGNGQNTQTLLGSMLRIDINGGSPYTIPATNPFASNQQGRPEIYAWGLRNPWRWSFDRETGALWVADVGQNNWEEVNIITQPGNFGWNAKEGTHCYQSASCQNPAYIDPVIEYSHDYGCSITGGYVYRGKDISALRGEYLYADYCSGAVWSARANAEGSYESNKLIDSGLNIASFAEANDGEIYLVHLQGGIYKMIPG